MTLPWVCAEGAGTPNDNIFSWPTIADWDWKCYADNEADGGYPPFLNYYYGYFEDTGNNGDPNDYKLVLNLRQWGPDGQLTDLRYDEKEFYPVTEDGDPRVW